MEIKDIFYIGLFFYIYISAGSRRDPSKYGEAVVIAADILQNLSHSLALDIAKFIPEPGEINIGHMWQWRRIFDQIKAIRGDRLANIFLLGYTSAALIETQGDTTVKGRFLDTAKSIGIPEKTARILSENPRPLIEDPERFLLQKEAGDDKLIRHKQEGPAQKVERSKSSGVISVLFLTADPTDASRLRLGEELREIQEKLQLAKLREQFRLHQRMSVRPADISQALLDVQPQIVHFSGHGMATGALCFENQMGETHPIQPDALAALFEQFASQVKCVVLNACYSKIQANAIAEHIDYVIGTDQAISDKAAIAFAIGFYQALGAGRTIEEAYKLGCVQIRLQGIPEHLTPVLIKKGQA